MTAERALLVTGPSEQNPLGSYRLELLQFAP